MSSNINVSDLTVVIDKPSTVITSEDTYYHYADYATTASYVETSSVALALRVLPGDITTGSAEYTGSFYGNGSQLSHIIDAGNSSPSSPINESILVSSVVTPDTSRSIKIISIWKRVGSTDNPDIGIKINNEYLVPLTSIDNNALITSYIIPVAAQNQECASTIVDNTSSSSETSFIQLTSDWTSDITIDFIASFGTSTSDTVQVVKYFIEFI